MTTDLFRSEPREVDTSKLEAALSSHPNILEILEVVFPDTKWEPSDIAGGCATLATAAAIEDVIVVDPRHSIPMQTVDELLDRYLDPKATQEERWSLRSLMATARTFAAIKVVLDLAKENLQP